MTPDQMKARNKATGRWRADGHPEDVAAMGVGALFLIILSGLAAIAFLGMSEAMWRGVIDPPACPPDLCPQMWEDYEPAEFPFYR
jgi:hypothetical protein